MAKQRKYKNIKIERNGIKYDSLKEYRYHLYLLSEQLKGDICRIELQPRYDLIINGVNCGFYKGDFLVIYKSKPRELIDVKGIKLPIYNLKKKLVKALYGVDIIEV